MAEKAIRASTAAFLPSAPGLSEDALYCDLKLRSQTASSARPCAMLARRATVHGVLASKSLSSVSISSGFRYPARTYGRAVLASVDRDRRRKVLNSGSCDADGGDSLWCARYDSRPLLKANEPSGSAESDKRSRAWSAGHNQYVYVHVDSGIGPAPGSVVGGEGTLCCWLNCALASRRRLSRSAISSWRDC